MRLSVSKRISNQRLLHLVERDLTPHSRCSYGVTLPLAAFFGYYGLPQHLIIFSSARCSTDPRKLTNKPAK
jgi:hypothetical protein